jgi:hypothetical protein
MAEFDKPKRKIPTSKQKQSQYVVDGIRRPPAVERQINEAFAIAFRGEVGRKVLNYLRSISVNRAHEPGTDPNVIVQLEGARWMMGVIEQRLKNGEDKKP